MGVLRDIAQNTQFRETVIVTNPGETTRLCLADPNRYAIGFCSPSGMPGIITTNPNQTVGLGLKLVSDDIRWFNARDTAAFAQAQWFDVTNVGAIVIVVYEVTFPLQR